MRSKNDLQRFAHPLAQPSVCTINVLLLPRVSNLEDLILRYYITPRELHQKNNY
ncbi:hypothetical protein RND71_028718 [Anisodus tanguticus]|uniref:Uncharacterized protein n=1 Tax=Anisodus tanguticus TaxID=243964 RepID=A0AAE1VAA7_9SOLA|nr:hypothetical protein RND71_028718 [Anisodus tanguticus]